MENDCENGEDFLSNYESDTTYFLSQHDDNTISPQKETKFQCHRIEGKVHIFGEWFSVKKAIRSVVIGPDWPCVLFTFIFIVLPSVFIYLYLCLNDVEIIIFFIIFGLCIFGLTTVFLADPGLVRRYHHARNRHWTYCDHCESFRPPKTVHCSTCQVCIQDYDHHCPWTGKCVGGGNIFFFRIFLFSLLWLVLYTIVLGVLYGMQIS